MGARPCAQEHKAAGDHGNQAASQAEGQGPCWASVQGLPCPHQLGA